MSNLATKYCGLEFENPFLLASAPPTATIDMIARGFNAGWGGAVTKTIKPDTMNIADVSPRFAALRNGKGKIYGFENFELVSKMDLAYWEKGIGQLRTRFPGKVLIASIMGASEKESWSDLARRMEGAGAQALELNFSCPHGMPEMGGGAAIGQNPEIVERITGWVKAVVNIPVIVKLTPNVTRIDVQALAAKKGGADGLAAINTVECLMGVDLDNLNPLPSVNSSSTFGGYSGKAVKPIGLRVVAQTAAAVDLPIMGLGGISDWKDAAEYLAVGAACVQVCTEVMISGYIIIDGMVKGLEHYLRSRGYGNAAEIRGAALRKLSSHEVLSRFERILPDIDPDKCVGCGKCVTACADGGYQALYLRAGTASVEIVKCDGCGLCRYVCPTDAISFKSADTAVKAVG